MKTLVVGSAMIDMLMLIDRIPESGEDVLCKENKVMVGGCAYNVASTLRNLECEHDLCVPVGTGPYANIVREELSKKKYPVMFEDFEQDNGYCLCLVESDGERTFITAQGAETEFKEEWFDRLDMDLYDKVYVAGYQVCGKSGRTIVNWLKGLKKQTVYFAPGPVICEIDKGLMKEILSLHPILHINEKELLDFTGEASVAEGLSNLYMQSENLVIVTTGKKGVAYFDGQQMEEVPGRNANVTDTIGAGDSHVAAVMAGMTMGKNLRDSMILANEVAANIVEIQGPVMDKEEFEKRMRGNGL